VIGGLLAKLAASAWACAALRYGLTALAILLFLLALRRSGERAGRLPASSNPRIPGSPDHPFLGHKLLRLPEARSFQSGERDLR
jgi:hypothetical protein